MKLPNGKAAEVDERKIQDYLLSTSHPVGHFKAAFFARVGFTGDTAAAFKSELLRIAANEEVAAVQESTYGRKYVIHGIVTAPSGGTAEITSIWILPTGSSLPRLVTVYPR